MIEEISVDTAASFKGAPQVFGPLKQINFLYGANGSGKADTILGKIRASLTKPEKS
jgi:hypothetical protein